MSDPMQSPGAVDTGQAAGVSSQAPITPTGSAEPGQSVQAQGQAVSTPNQSAEPVFFDINLLPPEQREALMPAYKQMQGAFTRKTQEISSHRQKIEAYDNFMRDPVKEMQNMAAQMGYSLTKAQAREALNQQAGEDWQPQTWSEVLSRAKEVARQEILQELGPVLENVKTMRADSIEKQLNEIDSNWRLYEDEMKKNLTLAPGLVNEPAKLYKISVPDEILESKATQKALAKLEAKTQAASVSGKTDTSRSSPADEKVTDFESAVAAAKKKTAGR